MEKWIFEMLEISPNECFIEILLIFFDADIVFDIMKQIFVF